MLNATIYAYKLLRTTSFEKDCSVCANIFTVAATKDK